MCALMPSLSVSIGNNIREYQRRGISENKYSREIYIYSYQLNVVVIDVLILMENILKYPLTLYLGVEEQELDLERKSTLEESAKL